MNKSMKRILFCLTALIPMIGFSADNYQEMREAARKERLLDSDKRPDSPTWFQPLEEW